MISIKSSPYYKVGFAKAILSLIKEMASGESKSHLIVEECDRGIAAMDYEDKDELPTIQP